MPADPTIRYVQHAAIDLQKWDAAIMGADKALVYAYSFYLGHMSPGWDALVLDDYEAIMPLTWKKKLGIKYLYQPFLTAQLGVFGKGINESTTKSFLDSIPSSFRLIEISLNAGNLLPPSSTVQHRSNYVLDLDRPYDEIRNAYRENVTRNIKKSEKAGFVIKKDFDVEEVINIALTQMKGYGEDPGNNIDRFRELYRYLHKLDAAHTYGIVSPAGELLASAVFITWQQRAYYILVGNHPNGRTLGASHALIDAFIKDYAGKPWLLDFEGSDIRNLAFFYSSFGASLETYPAIRVNRLPFYLKWIKG